MLGGVVVDDSRLFTCKLQEWEDFYNFDPASCPARVHSHRCRAVWPKPPG
jgi:hypothetical protein